MCRGGGTSPSIMKWLCPMYICLYIVTFHIPIILFLPVILKVGCGWLSVAMYLSSLVYAKIIFQISELYDKGFKRYSHFYMYHSPISGECFSSLVQPVMSQAENCEHLKEVLIE